METYPKRLSAVSTVGLIIFALNFRVVVSKKIVEKIAIQISGKLSELMMTVVELRKRDRFSGIVA